ncbi:bifunctional pyr operon transcriptional regulator/uracil phosphoribosyltransferase PyrR [Nitrospirota bacterium]
MQKKLLDAKEMDRALVRVSHEIVEHNKGAQEVCIVGIQRGGVHLAQRLAQKIGAIEDVVVPVGSLDITFYRDDLMIRKQPEVSRTEIDFDLNDWNVVLVDDVFFTGRSIRAAMDALMDMGRPASIQLAVLIDRGHRELPIRADYVGKNLPTGNDERVDVLLTEDDNKVDVVYLRRDVDGA